jgi:ferric iron reductase protein FhuF
VIVGLISIGAGLVAYAIQNYYVRKNEIERREYRYRRKQYETLVKKAVFAIYTLQTLSEKATSLDFKLQWDEVTYLMYLYASGNVIRALKSFINKGEGAEEEFKVLISAMRDDLNFKKGDLKVSEIQWFRTT